MHHLLNISSNKVVYNVGNNKVNDKLEKQLALEF